MRKTNFVAKLYNKITLLYLFKRPKYNIYNKFNIF